MGSIWDKDSDIKGLLWNKESWDEYLYRRNIDKKTLKRINILLKDILRNPFSGSGKPDPLKNNYSGYWSRRIDDKNCLIYKVDDSLINIKHCIGHYR